MRMTPLPEGLRMRLSGSWKRIREEKGERMGKVPQGTYTSVFRKFYASNMKNMRKEYESIESATKAQVSMLRIMSQERIYDARIIRRRNVLYLQKESGSDFKEQTMRRFLEVR